MSDAPVRNDTRGVWLVVAAALLWSTGGLGIKGISDGAVVVAFYRSAIAAVALLAIFRPRRFPLTLPFLTAVVSYAACVDTFVIATKLTTAANAIFLQYSGIVWVMIFSPMVLRERLRRVDLLASAVAIGGMALFFVGRFEGGTLTGNLVGVLSGVFFAAMVMALRFVRGEGAEAAVCWGNVLAAVALLPWVGDGLAVSAHSAAVLIFLGLVQIALAYWFFVKGIERVTASVAFLTGMIEPVANPIWVFLLLGERPSGFAMIGGAVVLAAVAMRTIAIERR